MTPEIQIGRRAVGPIHPPLVIAEIGINHEGDVNKAVEMVDEAAGVGCECVKIQTHIIEDEMIPNDVVPGNAKESIWEIMERCSLTAEEELRIKERAEGHGMTFLSTPFSRAAADRLASIGVCAFKIGSGECNNYPLVRHIARYGKPVILSTGMNDLNTIAPAVSILREFGVPYGLLHCTSLYPTPYEQVRLRAIRDLQESFQDAVVGLSDHSLGIYTSLAAVALGGCIIEKHFTKDKSWPGPDVGISVDGSELKELIVGVGAVKKALTGGKSILEEEEATYRFAYSSVVSIDDIDPGTLLTERNVWVKRPGNGEIKAEGYDKVIGRRARRFIKKDTQLSWNDVK